MLGLRRIREFNFPKLNHKVQKSVNFNSSYFRHVRSFLPWSKKGNSTFRSWIITSRAFTASSHSQWLLRSRKNKFNFSKLTFKVLKSVNFRQSHSMHVRSLSCREAKKESKRSLSHVVDPPTESATGPFPSAYFRTKVRSKGFMPEIKRIFNPKKGCEQNCCPGGPQNKSEGKWKEG